MKSTTDGSLTKAHFDLFESKLGSVGLHKRVQSDLDGNVSKMQFRKLLIRAVSEDYIGNRGQGSIGLDQWLKEWGHLFDKMVDKATKLAQRIFFSVDTPSEHLFDKKEMQDVFINLFRKLDTDADHTLSRSELDAWLTSDDPWLSNSADDGSILKALLITVAVIVLVLVVAIVFFLVYSKSA